MNINTVTSMERVIARQMYCFFKQNKILHKAQHGFVKGHSTCTNLLESINDWTLSVNDKHGVTVVYIDFIRAFDPVSQRKLIEARLTFYGIGGNLLNWLRNLLSERTHQTKIDSVKSAIAKLLSGVIQGSGVGPLLFLTYIYELIDIMESCGVTIKLSADDANIYAEIIDISDVEKLQRVDVSVERRSEKCAITCDTEPTNAFRCRHLELRRRMKFQIAFSR